MTEPTTMTEAEINNEMEALMELGGLQARRGDTAGALATLRRVEQLALRLPRKRDALMRSLKDLVAIVIVGLLLLWLAWG
jgi:Flp pilus assembly protein TadD